MYRSSVSETWCKLLFNFASIPFVLLLITLVASQVMSAREYSELESSGSRRSGEYSGQVLF